MQLLKNIIVLMAAIAAVTTAPANITILATNTSMDVAKLSPRQVYRHCEIIGRNSVHLIVYPFNDGVHEFGMMEEYPQCLKGLKDELKKRCCDHINNWECRIDPGRPAMGFQIAFTFGIFCKRPDHCIEDAYFAVNPENPREDFICQ